MRIGTRITLVTTALVMTALVLYGYASVRIRRAELRADLERQSQSVAMVLQVSLEAALREGLFEDVRRLVWRIEQAERPIGIAYVELDGDPTNDTPGDPNDTTAPAPSRADDASATTPTSQPGDVADDEAIYRPPPPDPDRDARIRRVQIDGNAFGEHVEQAGRLVYAYTVPLRDEQDRVVAAIDLTRDESDAQAALATTQRNVATTVVILALGLALLVWLTTRRTITHPLARLVEGIDEVSRGDLTRAILRERDDEIGELGERFTRMTANLREARRETERSVEARLALEARLRQSEKLAAIGLLAASIAHEVGTPLGVIGGRARTMEKKAADPQEVAKNAGIIAAQTARITRIIQQLLDFARQKPSVREPVDLAAVVRSTLEFLDPQLAAAGVEVRALPFVREGGDEGAAGELDAPSAPVVLADADEAQQVGINLVMNAMQAMPSGGVIELGLCGLLRRKPGLDRAPPGRYVMLSVADQGSGIADEDRERIFEPFYSTKHSGKHVGGGTGLGLAISLGLVKEHDGWIEIDGAPGGGTVFRVFLPAAE